MRTANDGLKRRCSKTVDGDDAGDDNGGDDDAGDVEESGDKENGGENRDGDDEKRCQPVGMAAQTKSSLLSEYGHAGVSRRLFPRLP